MTQMLRERVEAVATLVVTGVVLLVGLLYYGEVVDYTSLLLGAAILCLLVVALLLNPNLDINARNLLYPVVPVGRTGVTGRWFPPSYSRAPFYRG